MPNIVEILHDLRLAYDPKYIPLGLHYSHYVRELLEKCLKENPDLGWGVEGWIEYDVTGGGVYTLRVEYINVGDPYVETITWRNRDPMHPAEGTFYVEGWGDAQEQIERARKEWVEDNEDDPMPDDGLVDDWTPPDDEEDEIRVEIEVPRGWDSVETSH